MPDFRFLAKFRLAVATATVSHKDRTGRSETAVVDERDIDHGSGKEAPSRTAAMRVVETWVVQQIAKGSASAEIL